MKNFLRRYAEPFVAAWVVVGYLHALQCLAVAGIVGSLPWLLALFLPVIPFEMWTTRRFARPDISPRRRRWTTIGNVAFWLIAFVAWVVLITVFARQSPGVRFYFPRFYLFAIVLWRASGYLTLVALAVWLAAYALATGRGRRLRLATAVALPVALTFLLFWHQFTLGGPGGRNADRVAAQVGVELILDQAQLTAAIADGTARRAPGALLNSGDATAPADAPVEVRFQPRGIRYDAATGDCLLFYGCTYCNAHDGVLSPVIVRINLARGDITYLVGDVNIRQIDAPGDTIFVTPWLSRYIFEIDRTDLTVRRRFANQVEGSLERWEPMSVLRDTAADRLYVGTEMHPILAAYDLRDGALVDYLDFQRDGLIPTGGTAYTLVQSPSTRRLYLIGLPGDHDIIEVDVDAMAVTRTLNVGDPLGTALILDDEAGRLYYQSGFDDSLLAIDVATWRVVREYEGEFHARRLRLDRARRVLYILGYSSGYVTALDLETGEHLWRVRVGGRAHGMALVEDRLLVHSMAGAFVLDLPTIWRDRGYDLTR